MSKKSRTKNLLNNVRNHIFVLSVTEDHVTKEELASRFRARQHEVADVLHVLNLEGLVSQAKHHRCCWCPFPHGNPRCNNWFPDFYNILV